MINRTRITLVSLVIFLGMCSQSWAVEITGEQAMTAVKTWIGRTPSPFGMKTGTRSTSVKTHRDVNGKALFHVVNLENDGVVLTTADDEFSPILAVVSGNSFDDSPANPLVAIAERDLSRRKERLRTKNAQLTPGQKFSSSGTEIEWADLLNEGDVANLKSGGLSSVTDVQVSPLVTSTWGQSTIAGVGNVYNYFTPGNAVCGCVATAAAQLMRKHQFPTASLTSRGFACTYQASAYQSSVDKTYYTKGGSYNWSSMPLNPGSGISTDQIQAIAKLTYDVAVASRMNFTLTSAGSGTMAYYTVQSLTDYFGYASAKNHTRVNSAGGVSDVKQTAVLSNLDAGYPVLVGLTASSGGGHEVVGDGYGYSSGRIYIHLNLGWGGSDDAWYALPPVSTTGYDFDIFDEISYNIFPSRTGEVISGRVINANSVAQSGVTVEAKNALGTVIDRTTSSSKGIYALIVPSSATYTIVAKSSSGEASANVSVGTSYNGSSFTGLTTIGSTVGNSWGNDLTLQASSAPSNDDFGNATVISGQSGSTTGSNVGATSQSGEPLLTSYSSATTTVWWKWTAPTDGCVTIDTIGSSFNTQMCVYRAPSMALSFALFSLVANNDDGGASNTSVCTFDCTSGTTYYICIGGYQGKSGSIALNWNLMVSEFLITDGTLISYRGAGGNVTIPSSVTAIGGSAFTGNKNLTGVIIPSSVTSIGGGAFSGCLNLSGEVVIPSSVSSIGESVFANCTALTAVTVDSGNAAYCSVDGVLYTKDKSMLLCFPGGKDGPAVIETGVRTIARNAFNGCKKLLTITIPASVTTIGGFAFDENPQLVSVYFEGNAPTDVGAYIFNCSPNLVTYVHDDSTGWKTAGSSELPDKWQSHPIAYCPSTIEFDAKGGSKASATFPNTSGKRWYLNTATRPSWVTSLCLVTTPGMSVMTLGTSASSSIAWTGNAYFSFTAAANTTGSERSWTVTARNSDDNEIKTFHLHQPADSKPDLTVKALDDSWPAPIFLSHDQELEPITSFERGSADIRFSVCVWNIGTVATSGNFMNKGSIEDCDGNVVYCFDVETTYVCNHGSWCFYWGWGAWPGAFSGLQPGDYVFKFKTDSNDDIDESDENNNEYAIRFTVTGPPRPVNDDFDDAIVLNGASGSVTGNNVNCTKENGEPYHEQWVRTNSVWYAWKAPSTGYVTFSTDGSDYASTCLSVYTGSSVSSLTHVAGAYGSGSNYANVRFKVVSGTTYRIALAEYYGQTGAVVLNWSMADEFEIVNGNLRSYNGTAKNITIPSGVVSISRYVFQNSGVEYVTLNPEMRDMELAFMGCQTLKGVVLNEGLVSISEGAFYMCTSLSSVTLPSTVKELAEEAFCGCTSLKDVYLNEGLEEIGDSAFRTCAITSIDLPDTVKRIGKNAFQTCPLEKLLIPDSVLEIGFYAFGNCTSLKHIELGNAVTNIGASAFRMAAIREITVPASVQRLGVDGLSSDGSFWLCEKLTNVIFEGNAPLVSSRLYAGTPETLVTHVGYGSTGWNGTVGSTALPTSWPVGAGGDARAIAYTVVPPSAPTNVSATDGTYFDKVDITWAASSGATSYDLYRSTTATRPSAATKTDVTSPCNDTTATPGVKYYYWVSAVNSAGSSFSSYDTGYRAVSVSIGTTSASFDAAGGAGSTTVTANTSWSATADVSWITFTTASGSGNGSVAYTVAASTSTEPRTGTITITVGAGTSHSVTKTITVSQGAAESDGKMPDLTFAQFSGWNHNFAIFTVAQGGGSTNTPLRVFDKGEGFSLAYGYANFGEGVATGTMTNRIELFDVDDELVYENDGDETIDFEQYWGRSQVFTAYAWEDLEPGAYIAQVSLDAYDQIAEEDEDNNVGTFRFAVRDPVSLNEALDNTALTFTTDVEKGWFGTKGLGADGVDAAQCTHIGHSSTNSMSTTVTGPGTISFKWKVSSENGWDELCFLVDGARRVSMSGIGGDWDERSYELPSGAHTLTWSYCKDDNYSDGVDCGWVDQVTWTPSADPATAKANLLFNPPAGWPQAVYFTDAKGSRIAKQEFTPQEFTSDDRVYLNVSFKNAGIADACAYQISNKIFDSSGNQKSDLIYIDCKTGQLAGNTSFLLDWDVTDKITQLDPGIYTFKCTLDCNGAVDEENELDNVYDFTFEVKSAQLPTAPNGVAATDGTYSDKVSISWTGSSGATSYNLYRSTTSTRPSTATETGVTSPYSDTTATPGTKYYYWVSAVNSAGASYSTSDTGYRAVSLALGKSSDSYTADGGSGSASVTANTSWSASADVSWITLGTSSGSGNGTLTYTVAANSSADSRTGTITVSAGSGTAHPATRTVVVTQGGGSIAVATPVILPTDGSTFNTDSCTVTITCATPGATIYYSTNGSTPRQKDQFKYTQPFTITGTTTVKAIAVKDGFTQSEIATVTITKVDPPPLTLAFALDEPKLSAVETVGDAEWEPVKDATAVGGSSARSGVVGMLQRTCLKATVYGKGSLSFKWKVSCEADYPGEYTYDHMTFSTVEGGRTNDIAKIDGKTEWLPESVTFTTDGPHVILWAYSTDDFEESGYEDCGWVDNVVWTGDAPPSDIVIPDVVTLPKAEVESYMAKYPSLAAQAGGDAETFAKLPSVAGKLDANGNQMYVWQDIVAGTDPTDPKSKFTAKIEMGTDGQPVVTWDPALNGEGVRTGKRTYTVMGSKVLSNDPKDWTVCDEGKEGEFYYFKVFVEMP